MPKFIVQLSVVTRTCKNIVVEAPSLIAAYNTSYDLYELEDCVGDDWLEDYDYRDGGHKEPMVVACTADLPASYVVGEKDGVETITKL